MKKQPNLTQNTDELRRKAEQRLTAKPEIVPATPSDEKRLLHELQVHQIELEMQNEALLQAYYELEESRDRFVDLYDFGAM